MAENQEERLSLDEANIAIDEFARVEQASESGLDFLSAEVESREEDGAASVDVNVRESAKGTKKRSVLGQTRCGETLTCI